MPPIDMSMKSQEVGEAAVRFHSRRMVYFVDVCLGKGRNKNWRIGTRKASVVAVVNAGDLGVRYPQIGRPPGLRYIQTEALLPTSGRRNRWQLANFGLEVEMRRDGRTSSAAR